MRLGVVVLPEQPWREAAGIWRDAEDLGFAHGWTYDHLAWSSLRDSSWFGALPVLAAAASVTSRMRLGTLVASPNFRHPVALAREVLALDDISEGRFDLGIGAGGQGWDATILGQEPWTPAERSARFAEFVELTDALLTERRVTYSGSYYSAADARSYPGCRQQPRVPFIVAATGPKAMELVARFGQGWVTTGPRTHVRELDAQEGAEAVRAQVELLESACDAVGRDPDELGRFVLLGPGLAQGLSSSEEFTDTLGQYAAVGFTDCVVHWPRPSEPYQGERTRFEQIISSQLM
jgi:alkanesulfonate monooxygenase SsuD/methylene tetrahydromethanopterin reductase-like flavin-dependent oxidoreductase (luciferase family)